jgi:hypothetical protein
MNRLLLFLFAIVAVLPAYAYPPTIDANAFYFTDTFNYNSANSAYKRMMIDVSVGLPLTKKGNWVLGWNYGSYALSENPGTETSLKITDMGPKLEYYLNKDRTWLIAATYNLISKATYTSGTSTELRGTSLKVEAGYMPMMWESVFMGAKLNWYKANFKEEITNQTSLAQVTHGRTIIYPTLAVTFRWD